MIGAASLFTNIYEKKSSSIIFSHHRVADDIARRGISNDARFRKMSAVRLVALFKAQSERTQTCSREIERSRRTFQ